MHTHMSANRMFVLLATMTSQSSNCLNVASEDISDLWHRRFGHLSHNNLRILQHRNLVKGLPQLKASNKICTSCMVGKQHREAMPRKSQWRASQQLQLIHADICGPITPTSNSNKRYLLTFIDDFSRKIWVYFLAEKCEAFISFKNYKNLVEKESRLSICCLRTDRGGEFTSKEFNEFCTVHGIKRQLTTAYTPQQNGVAERKNRTIMNMVRCLLSEKEMPKPFWPEAVRWTVYVLNRSPTLSVKDKTPEESWSGIKPSVEHFRVFGCIGHVHIPDAKRLKLDDKSHRCVLLGMSDESKAYRLFDPVKKKVVISRDVQFDEKESWNWGRSEEEARHDILEWGDSDEELSNTEENEVDIEEEHHNVGSDSGESTEASMPNSPVVDTPSSLEERNRRPPVWMQDYISGDGLSEEEEEVPNLAMFISYEDPTSYEEAVKSEKWRSAMDLEIAAIVKNETWELVSLPIGAKRIGVKWVYKTKLNENGEIDKCKARLVVKGYAQKHGIDYNEVFAPVARWDTIRMVLAIAAQKGWTVFQLDVKSAFLHGELSETVFIEQPLGYVQEGEEDKVYRLKKALYGLKQAPRAWYSRIEGYFIKEGFARCSYEPTLFVKTEGGKILVVSLYVDDLIYTGNDVGMCEKFKKSMKLEFDMTDLGKMKYFLGVEVQQSSKGIHLCQRKYAREILDRFGMGSCNSVKNPMVPGTKLSKEVGGADVDATLFKQMVGSLMYLTATRPDMMYVVCLISRYMAKPKEAHMLAAKRVLRYLKGTLDLGVFYKRGVKDVLLAFTDSDYAGDVDDRKSTSGYVFLMCEGAVSWSSKKQPVVALSTTEAEFVAAAACACQGVWMKRILNQLGHTNCKCISVLCDNNSTIKLSRNPVMHGRSKHIDVRFHFLRDLTRDGAVKLEYCGTNEQVADVMTKPLKLETFEKFRKLLGVRSIAEVN